ncbi:MAG: single-stranded-DNA-specific exonuclease RecJ [Patescibacteria group bacterium]
MTKWKIRQKIDQDFIDKFPEINGLVLQLLHNRGLKVQKEIDDFLNPNYEEQILDPYLFKDMAKAIGRLFEAINKREKVMIYGDYDADGVCSTAILYTTLVALGLEVDTYIPFRESEGYGINVKSAQQIISQGFDLVITVDCGISNKNEIAMFNQEGIDVIVLDHHDEPLEMPEALAIINPSVRNSGYPRIELCGAGVVYKFVQAIVSHQDKINSPIKLPVGFEKWLLDLVAIATVGDIVPLTSENRIFVKYGLIVLEKSKNIGIKKLVSMVNNHKGKFDTEYLGWRIVPRINAAGRVQHASIAFNLLASRDDEEAGRWIELLENNNKQRQQTTEKILSQALEQVTELTDKEKIIIVVGEGWSAGVVGLVAGKLCDRYGRPALVFGRTVEGENVKYVASGRSIEEFDITEALKECHEYILRFGGHPRACGLTIIGEDNFNKFKDKISGLANKKIVGIELLSKLDVDAEINLVEINWELLDELEKFEPYGEGNPQPLFVAYDLVVEQIQTVGNDGKHLKVLVSQGEDKNRLHKLIGFSFGEWCARLKSGDKIDIVFELGINEWNGNRELQLKIVDLKLSEK